MASAIGAPSAYTEEPPMPVEHPVSPPKPRAGFPPVVPPDEWAAWPDEKLLDLRMCELGLTIEGSALETRIAELQRELDARGLSSFQPHFWLSAEWFSPALMATRRMIVSQLAAFRSYLSTASLPPDSAERRLSSIMPTPPL